ncbi:MAG TPA: AMP-binding protein [Streptosporangiaceae bacterium]
MSARPLHAVLLPPGGPGWPLARLLPAALDGTGPAIMPLDGGLPPARLAALLDALRPGAVQTPGQAERDDPRWRPRQAGPGVEPDIAVVVVTSGSTGQPKGVQLSAAALIASARASVRRIGAGPGARWLACLPAFHIAGLQVLVRSLLAGTEPAPCGQLDPAAVAAHPGAFVSVVPTQLRRLTEAGADLSALAAILLGGAAVPPGLLDAAAAAGGRVVTTYGLSETCGGCVYDGVPLDGVRARIGADGRIRIAGPVLFSGYRLRPEETARAFDDGWFVTSDLGSAGPGGVLEVRGRADDMINTGGAKVAAAAVEAALASCPGVAEVAVIGVPDEEWGQLVTAIVVPADPGRPPELAQLRSHVRDRLGGKAAPRQLRLVASLPLLATGKPDREALRALG